MTGADRIITANQPGGRPRILVVEDYWLVAMQMQLALECEGCEVVGPAGTVEGALDLIRLNDLSGAILDVSLGDTTSYPVAEALAERRIPFAFSTASDVESLPERYRLRPYLPKPVRPSGIKAFVRSVRANARAPGSAAT